MLFYLQSSTVVLLSCTLDSDYKVGQSYTQW